MAEGLRVRQSFRRLSLSTDLLNAYLEEKHCVGLGARPVFNSDGTVTLRYRERKIKNDVFVFWGCILRLHMLVFVFNTG